MPNSLVWHFLTFCAFLCVPYASALLPRTPSWVLVSHLSDWDTFFGKQRHRLSQLTASSLLCLFRLLICWHLSQWKMRFKVLLSTKTRTWILQGFAADPVLLLVTISLLFTFSSQNPPQCWNYLINLSYILESLFTSLVYGSILINYKHTNPLSANKLLKDAVCPHTLSSSRVNPDIHQPAGEREQNPNHCSCRDVSVWILTITDFKLG